MKKVLFLQGIPASGKTTYANEILNNDASWVRVNRDDLRNMRGKYWIPSQEDMITDWEVSNIKTALSHGKNVIVDATNLKDKYISTLKTKILNNFNNSVNFSQRYFPIYPYEAILRDRKRENPVGSDVIINMFSKYIAPKQNPKLDKAVIFDVDGTLAKRKNRNIYEWDKVYTDEVIHPMRMLYNEYASMGYKIVVISGRDEACLDITKQWILDNEMQLPDDMYFKPINSREKSYRFKYDVFESEIINKYYVEFAVDDREQDIHTWKALGLKTIHVNLE